MQTEFKNSVSSFVWRYIKPYKLAQCGFFIIALFWAIELTLTPYLLKKIIDVTTLHPGRNVIIPILWPCVLYAAMTLWMNLNFRLFDYITLILYPAIKSRIGQEMFDYCSLHAYDFFQNNFSGALTKKIFDMSVSVEKIIEIINVWFYPRLLSLVIAASTVAYVVQPIFGVVLIVWTIVYTALSFFGARWTEQHAYNHSKARADMSGTLSDSLSNVILTKLFSNEGYESAQVDKSLSNLVTLDRKVSKVQLGINFFQGLMVTLLISLMLWILVHYYAISKIESSDFVFVLTLSMFIGNSVHQIGLQMLEFSKSVAQCRQALSFLIKPHGVRNHLGAQPLMIHGGRIEFKNVCFSYRNNKTLFHQLNVTLDPGQKVGLVGLSGAGKSTFIKLILRLMDVSAGSILIDGQVIEAVDKTSLRQKITTVPQETALFFRSILDNIRFARPTASDSEVIDAAKAAFCHDFILQLPDGYSTLVGERGVKLSGGEKQRIAIARAFLKNAPILLLDEATSALDSATESSIQSSLTSLMKDKTTLVIAHRLSTLQKMNRILVFESGKIVQDGTLDELVADKSGAFFQFWQLQSTTFMGR